MFLNGFQVFLNGFSPFSMCLEAFYDCFELHTAAPILQIHRWPTDGPPMAHRWPSALPGDLRRGKQRKLHKTSLIWAFKAAGHPFSGGCQVLHFWCKDAGACRLFSACFYPRALVREFSTGANVAHHRRICDSPDYFCSCTDYRTHQGSNSHTFIAQRKTFSSFRLGYAISQSSRPL